MSRPPDLADRVAEFIAEHELLEPGQPLLTLVSGGADSLCLWGVMRELGHPVEALHVEHGLRGSRGLDDAAYCAALGASVVPVDLEPGGNLEARAREARYGAARELADGRPIATGHTLSDQAETVVYRLASSSGPRAISAMRPRRGRGGAAAAVRDGGRDAGLVRRAAGSSRAMTRPTPTPRSAAT